MRRPPVDERSALRASRCPHPEPSGDCGFAAGAVMLPPPSPHLLRQAEAVGAVALACHLAQALSEAEGIVRRSDRRTRT